MNKLSKVLALVLLLAVAVSAFGIFASFAEETAAEEWEQHFKTLYDMDALNSITMSSVGGSYPNYPSIHKGTEAGQKIWTLSMDDAKVGATGNSQDFFNTMSTTYGVRFRDNTSTATNIAGAKNTNYIIFDLDVATDTEFIDDIYLNLRILTSKSTTYKSNIVNNAFPAIGRASDGSLYVSTHKGSNVLYARDVLGAEPDRDYLPEGSIDKKWTNITFVYDFHPYTVTDEETGEQTTAISNNCYVYFDGIYAGEITCFTSSATSLYFARLQTINSDIVKTANTSTQFANFTIKTVSSNYSGILDNEGTLGNADVNLADIPELAYCLEDCISGTPESGYKHKLADIHRGEQIIPVYDADDLHGKLQDGDTVVAYANLSNYRKSYAVKMVSKTTTTTNEETGEVTTVTEDVPANITWTNEAGKDATPKVVDIPSGATWAALKGDGTLYRSGTENVAYQTTYVAKNSSGKNTTYYVVHDELFAARYALLNSAKTNGEIILFDDYVGVGSGSSADLEALASYNPEGYEAFMALGGDPTTTGSSAPRINTNRTFTLNLNGYSFKNASWYQHQFIVYGGDLIIKNGTLIQGSGVMNMIMHGAGEDSTALFKNVNVQSEGSTFADHRYGHTYYKYCDVNVPDELDNIKAVGSGHTYLHIYDSKIAGTASLVNMSQVNSSGRYGGGNIHIDIQNTEINCGGNVLVAQPYANAANHTETNYVKNEVNYFVNINNTKINSYGVVMSIGVAGLPGAVDKDGKLTTSEGTLKVFNHLDIANSEITSFAVLAQSAATTDPTKAVLTSDVSATGSKFALYRVEKGGSITRGGFTQLSQNGSVNVVNVTLAEGILLDTNAYAREGYVAPASVILPEGTKLVGTSTNGVYSFIVTSDYDTYTYKLGNEAPVEFYWNKAEGEVVDPSKVVTLADSEIYTYTWAQDGNAFATVLAKDFKVSAMSNLTLVEDFQFNLYIPAEQYAKYGAYLIIKDLNNNILTGEEITIDGVDYIKFKAKDVAPKQAEDAAMTVTIEFAGAYDDTYSVSNGLTVLDYTQKVINGGDADEIAFIDAILNYISAAYTVAGKDNANVNALISADASFATEIEGEAKLESTENLEIALNYGADLKWGIKATATATVTVEYTYNGNAATKTVELAEGDIFFISFKAYDMINSIKVNGAEVNLKGYYEGLGDNENAKAMVLAIYNYVKAAADYKAA